MAPRDRSWSERMRDLIEEVDRVRGEVDRVRGESERVRGQADRAMKHPFWPERRRMPRVESDDPEREHRNDA